VKTAPNSGLYRIPVFRCSLVREGSFLGSRPVADASDAAELVREYLFNVDREHFVVVLLNGRNECIGVNTVSIGGLGESLAHPREVFKPAILAGAAAVVLGHNHPSGDPDPSTADVATTRRLKQAGEVLGIPVLDHVIVAYPGKWASLKLLDLL
jgi:DNA repair protein RadC